MTYGHLQADCLYTGISSGPNARYRVWEAFTFLPLPYRQTFSVRPRVSGAKYRSCSPNDQHPCVCMVSAGHGDKTGTQSSTMDTLASTRSSTYITIGSQTVNVWYSEERSRQVGTFVAVPTKRSTRLYSLCTIMLHISLSLDVALSEKR